MPQNSSQSLRLEPNLDLSGARLDLLCPTSNSSASFPCLRFSSDPLSRPGLNSWALIGQDATCSSLLIGREANPSVTASKARARPHSWSQQDSCVITKIQITRSKLAVLWLFQVFWRHGINHNLPLNFWDDETLQKIKWLSLTTIYLKWHLMS